MNIANKFIIIFHYVCALGTEIRHMPESRFHRFAKEFSPEQIPQMLNDPFGYIPGPVSLHAAQCVREYLDTVPELKQDALKGKMFGVLSVRDSDGTLGFIAAYSGLLAGSNDCGYFAPAVYDLLDPQGFFKKGEAILDTMTARIREFLAKGEQDAATAIAQERKRLSQNLQESIFSHFIMLSSEGERADLHAIFARTALRRPPSGAGECAAPKLFQYAFSHSMKPLEIAEFWYGAPPQGSVRKDGHFYPACSGKCGPILEFMLRGIPLRERIIGSESAFTETMPEVLYEDRYIVAVDKPAGMLAVPSKVAARCVEDCFTGCTAIHRLDMDTSGVMLLAKDRKPLMAFRKMFEGRAVRKSYIALLEGHTGNPGESGTIDLPLSGDYLERPYRKVDKATGKQAVTRYTILRHTLYNGQQATLMKLEPESGRTHQLRVHCAHKDGLEHPIIGDALYGTRGKRLCLHSYKLEFKHPFTGADIEITAPEISFASEADLQL